MGCRSREFTDDEAVSSSSSSSFSDALLFATMCIIGLPVDVHVKDGSVYSGIFYTASVETEYGIVLKKARMTKKGKSDTNIVNGAVIDSLVILSGDLVQVVAKGLLLPAYGFVGNMAGENTEAIAGAVPSDIRSKNVSKKSIDKTKIDAVRGPIQNGNGLAHGGMVIRAEKEHERRKLPLKHHKNAVEIKHGKSNESHSPRITEASSAIVYGRQVGDDGSVGKQDEFKQKLESCRRESVDNVHDTKLMSKLLPCGVSCDATTRIVNSYNQCCERTTSADSSFDVSSSFSTLLNSPADTSYRRLVPTSTEMVPHGSEFSKSSKEFKLNPGAKIFSPSFTKSITATPPPVPTVVSMGYIPNNSSMVPVVATLPELGFNHLSSRPSVPAKVVPYNNFTNGNGANDSQFSQPIVGHMGSRAQTVRYAGQYPVQAGPTYVHPNAQAVMVGRFGQLVYVHPVSQDLVQGAATMSDFPVLTPHQVPFSKHQGAAAGQAFQLCVPPPFMGSGQQPFPIAKSHPIFATSLPF